MDKQYILDESKRAAAANGGAPLGRERFTKETGIKNGEWERLWVRWSDAIREAGFQPNKMRERFNGDQVLDQLTALARQLGRFPVYAEIKMQRRRDPSFPHHGVFARFGGMKELEGALRRYCEDREGFADVAGMCEPAAHSSGAESTKRDREPPESFGSVYLLKSGRYYKIGHSGAVGRRERELALQLPERATVIHSIRTDDPPGIEAYWHRRFDAKRKNGEWFDLNAIDVKAFRRRTFM